MIDKVCKICGEKYVYDCKKSSHVNETCSYSCLRKTGLPRRKFLFTALTKRGILCKYDDDIQELESKYSKIMSDITKVSTIKKHQTIIKKYNNIHDAYSYAGKKSWNTRMKRFFIKNNINIDDVSEKNMQKTFLSYFNLVTNHGEKVKEGRLCAAGSEDVYKEIYRISCIKTACNFYPE